MNIRINNEDFEKSTTNSDKCIGKYIYTHIKFIKWIKYICTSITFIF